MTKFRYTVINTANKQLQGSINAPDEATARKELNELGFSVVAIEEGIEEAAEQEQHLPTFEFSAIDKNQKRVTGTIQGENDYEAYKRLISEFEFEVEYVIDNNITEANKEKMRQQGAYELQSRFEEESLLTAEKQTADEKDLEDFEKKQSILKQQIEFVLKKVKSMLDLYEKEMKQETKAKIKNYVEKILRIRNSTNLDYVRKTAEELLTYLQKEELFMHEDARAKERTKMVVEAKSLMMQLKQGKSKKNINITDAIRKWREINIVNNENPTSLKNFIDFFAKIILGVNNENDEIIKLKNDISTINDQLKQYITLYFQSPSQEFKIQTKEGIRNLWNQRKKLKKRIKKIKKEIIEQRRLSGEQTGIEKFSEEVLSFTGWLLTFYLIYYFISIYAISKDFGTLEIPELFYIYKSAFLKYFMATLFLLHGALSIKKNFFRKNEVATLMITPVFLLSVVIIYLNF